MKRITLNSRLIFATFSLGGLAACGSAEDPSQSASDPALAAVTPQVGDPLPGISATDFAAARDAFAEVETVDDGLGPIFNERGCGNCHSQGAIGGASEILERRFGRFDNGIFNALVNKGGSLRQLQTLGTWINSSGKTCTVPLEVEPAEATVRNVGRLTQPLFGLGLIDAMPDSFFTSLASSQPSSTRGIVSFVPVLLPDPSDPNQRVGSQRVGRFGWKANVPNLVQFSADAYVNEMGITTQSCFNGASITTFAVESAPNGVPVPSDCEDNLPGVDDPVGNCRARQTTIQEDLVLFTRFMTFLAPAPRGPGDSDTGRFFFDAADCNDCHTSTTFRTPATPTNGVPGNFAFNPFSDFLLHDMGSLGDQIGNTGDTQARTRMMRTAPLWGIRFRTRLLHDGRATDVRGAIQAHDGQGQGSRVRFNFMTSSQQQALIDYVLSL